MIGAIVYRLRAVTSASLPVAHGKLLHGLLFHRLQQFSPELSKFVHDKLNMKPFTTSYLRWIDKAPRKYGGSYYVERGNSCLWRVTALHEILLPPLLGWEVGSELRIGTVLFVVEKVMANPDEAKDSGVLDENELISSCLNVQKVHTITFQFLTPVSFRYFQADMPLPKPDLIYGSLADKWNQASMPLPLEKDLVKQIALQCQLVQWEGKSNRIFFTPKQGVTGFTGVFTFDLRKLAHSDSQILLLLAQFSVFSGVGRLTGQGMGQARVTYT